MPMPAANANLSQLSLADIEQLAAQQKCAPVAQWNPAPSGHSRMRILRDGRWLHDGAALTRETMIRLFASILRREEDGSYVLVTPAEKQAIDVDDAPFIAVEMKSEDAGEQRCIAVRLNTGDLIFLGPEHPLFARGTPEEPAHYILVRGGLEARVARPVYYELANIALTEGHDPIGIWSSGCFFNLEPATC